MAEYYVKVEMGKTNQTSERSPEGWVMYFDNDEGSARRVMKALRAVLRMVERIYMVQYGGIR